jgi:hypothetical protein
MICLVSNSGTVPMDKMWKRHSPRRQTQNKAEMEIGMRVTLWPIWSL